MRSRRGARRSSFDIVQVGLKRHYLGDLYHFLLDTPWPVLLGLLVLTFATSNALFALAYLAGDHAIENARPGSFSDAFFFSVQTMATIGYGKMAPQTLYANLLVSIEALSGAVGLALTTGLTFAKFARPTARVLFSGVAVVSERDTVPCFMFRMANERGIIVEAEAHVVLAWNGATVEGESVRRFQDLTLARSRNALFALSWTAIHPITPASPLHGATPESLAGAEAEVIVSLVGLEATLAQTVHARHTYRAQDIVWGARFVDILTRMPDGRRHVDYRRFHDVRPIGQAG
jgi:inward rectifier potassium channel